MSDDIFDMMGHAFELKHNETEQLRKSLVEARVLLHEAVDNYPVEEKQDLWSSRVRAWLRKYDEKVV